jgi:hypothetical protein
VEVTPDGTTWTDEALDDLIEVLPVKKVRSTRHQDSQGYR